MKPVLPVVILLASACSTAPTNEPRLAPRAAEAIDPRLPLPDQVPAGPVDTVLAERLRGLVDAARGGVQEFNGREALANRLAAAAGPMASESWIAAQQALSLLIEQYGVTTKAAGDIDAIAAGQLEGQRWIRPADQQAIAAASADVAEISSRQAEAIERLNSQLSR